jgi:UDP-N-acetylglucosamine 2-epimerase (non-hydrolysing)
VAKPSRARGLALPTLRTACRICSSANFKRYALACPPGNGRIKNEPAGAGLVWPFRGKVSILAHLYARCRVALAFDHMPLRLLHVVGARPNFPKLGPVLRAANGTTEQRIVHTGQHYDDALSAAFFRTLDLPEPDDWLAVGSGSHAAQTALILNRLEPVVTGFAPDWVVVYGDVNSTLAAALVASKLGVKIAHVEAGLRSGDRSMPEEINRIVTDRLANLLLAPSRDAVDALRGEGEPDEEIAFVGNVMVDSLLQALPRAALAQARQRLGLEGDYVLVTCHRPSNVDNPARLARIVETLDALARERPVVLAVHPRTRIALESVAKPIGRLRLIEPLPYLEMIDLMQHAFAVVTDSGGVQEETTMLGVPCFTLRHNTERPITISEGTNQLVAHPEALLELIPGAKRRSDLRRPEGWDGHAGERVVQAILARS